MVGWAELGNPEPVPYTGGENIQDSYRERDGKQQIQALAFPGREGTKQRQAPGNACSCKGDKQSVLWAPPHLHHGDHALVGDGVSADGEVARGVPADDAVNGVPVGRVRLIPVQHRQVCHHHLHPVLRHFSWILQRKDSSDTSDRSGHGGSFLSIPTPPSPLPSTTMPTGEPVPWRGPRSYSWRATHLVLSSGFPVFFFWLFSQSLTSPLSPKKNQPTIAQPLHKIQQCSKESNKKHSWYSCSVTATRELIVNSRGKWQTKMSKFFGMTISIYPKVFCLTQISVMAFYWFFSDFTSFYFFLSLDLILSHYLKCFLWFCHSLSWCLILSFSTDFHGACPVQAHPDTLTAFFSAFQSLIHHMDD